MDKIVTMDDYSRIAVENFIQTVVFVDDKIYESKGTVRAKTELVSPKERKKVGMEIHGSAGGALGPAISDSRTDFSSHDIQSSFAKKRIVCSLHQPRKGYSMGAESDTYKLCASADIVIIDWDLYGDAGDKATTLIETLVTKSLEEDPHQLRLVLVYTNDSDLFAISSKVYDKLVEKVPDEVALQEQDKGMAFHTLNARVVVLGKPAKRLARYEPYEVKEEGLADRAIEEFCNLSNGLLQGGILTGLAAIRKQSRKILSKFHSGLDGAFLTHRALGLPNEEAFNHITPLLMAEIEAVLEDSLPHPLIENSIIENWCDEHWKPAAHATNFTGEAVGDYRQFAKDFCTKGMGIVEIYESGKSDLGKTIKSLKKKSSWPTINDMPFKMLSTYLSNDEGGKELRELSILMSQRTHYDNSRYLSQGTIIQEQAGEKRYLLCLQPSCDCVRLKGSTVFIFCSMAVNADPKKNAATHVVYNEAKFEDLIYKPEIKSCVALEFKPNKGRIVAKDLEFVDVGKKEDDENKKYKWIAQLKPKHAHKAVEQFARELSRVGLTESEWLRLRAK